MSGLTVAESHSVIHHSRMPGSEAAHRNRLHSSRTAVVSQRDARQSSQRLRNISETHALEVFAIKGKDGCCAPDILRSRISLHGDFLDGVMQHDILRHGITTHGKPSPQGKANPFPH